ncbi:late competence development ComFB family protein [Dissulfurirhabdus thermomarina]|uniref:Late competence development ComFB family protein n=1 Tax=Dissulfurirhabdus thermomarina TaxID=1765737 RepID=A0A6N9TV98_DISTH|nr:late competence development ComFB family protein [Dissulfurirhabdus thermomarina]NDY43357.1 late competence development ComFB family protein [Dissulfurirhabdus thermomarina]NMX24143.1 late competence development ComFB family protein [Dissulfurirhabdus thermomarina]
MAETIYDLRDQLVNENEEKVMELVTRLQGEGRLPCACRDCLLDVTALALNHLKPRYAASMATDLFRTDEEVQRWEKAVREAVDLAITKVRARPHHG